MYCRLASVANAAASNPCGSVLRVAPTARASVADAEVGCPGSSDAEGMRQLGADGADGVKADGALLLALAVAPEYCSGAPDVCRRPRNIRSTKMPAKMTNPSSSIVPNPSDNPRCDINAASPSPAAMPAIGPSQRDAPDGAGVGVAAGGALGALAEAGALGCDGGGDDGEAALPAGAAGAAFCAGTLRCAPK